MTMQASEPEKATSLRLRQPTKEDGASVWELIKSTGILDLNSPYSYLMLCEYFPDTCVVAEEDHRIIGFVSAFRPPQARDTIFVWQVAVHESQKGKGLGRRLLEELLNRESCEDVHYLEATVSPSNLPSQSLFKGVAKRLNCPCEVSECFPEDLFPESGHEAEQTYRIGPF
ncbi:MAG TPA: diaminobutyrate acetyltransferase [Chondromyces sp.]|nr:diaminobutyrate acetyltransferase [Chondromyces sp.]